MTPHKEKTMIILGIESTAHTFGVALVDSEGNVLANEKDAVTTEEGGMIPSQVAQHHVDICDRVLKNALTKANKTMQDVDSIAFSQSPGMGHCLRIGCIVARSLSVLYNKPLIGVNHCISHLEIGRLKTPAQDPVLLYASGANTQVIAYEGGKYRIFGETLDQGVGNMLDSFAREAGLGFPGGPKIEKLALACKEKGNTEKAMRVIDLPYSVKGMDVSFAGILTNLTKKLEEKNEEGRKKYELEDLCYVVQEVVFAMLIEVSERAMAHTGKKELLLGGGVACNKRLQEMAKLMCEQRNGVAYWPENQFLVDNAAMIAWTGWLMWKAGERLPIEKSVKHPYLRTDDIEVTWR